MSAKSLKIWLAVSILVSLAVAPFLARGDQANHLRRQQYAAQIARMSDSQRAHLEQNEEIYRSMSSAERSSIEHLHQELQTDAAKGTGELTTVMHQYDAWLRTIEPYQRMQLDETTDPHKRIELMKEIVRNQREKAARRNMPFGGPGSEGSHWESMPTLDEKSLASVMNGIETLADKRLSSEQKEDLSEVQGLKRYFLLLQMLKEFGTGIHSRPLLESPPQEFVEVARHIDQYVDDPRIREFLAATPDDRPPQWILPPETRLTWLVSQGLLSELFKLRRAAAQATDVGQLEKFLATLPPDKEYELLELEAPDFQFRLRNEYLDSAGLNGLPGIHDFRELFGRPRMRGGDDRGPPGSGGPRDGRRFRGRRPDEPSPPPGERPLPPPAPRETAAPQNSQPDSE